MSEINLEEIRKRADAATRGPWTKDGELGEFVSQAGSYMAICRVNQTVSANPVTMTTQSDGYESHKPNVEFIAHAREDVPILLDHIASLQQQLADARRNALEEAAEIAEAHCIKSEGLSTQVIHTNGIAVRIAVAIREAKK